jgi:hypothetical protein
VSAIPLATDLSWRDNALCRLIPEPFRRQWGSTDSRAAQHCREICAQCPVLEECAEWVATQPAYAVLGIVAGMDTDERKALRVGRVTIAATTDEPLATQRCRADRHDIPVDAGWCAACLATPVNLEALRIA